MRACLRCLTSAQSANLIGAPRAVLQNFSHLLKSKDIPGELKQTRRMTRCFTKPRVRSDVSTPSDLGGKFTAELVEKLVSDPHAVTQGNLACRMERDGFVDSASSHVPALPPFNSDF